MAATGLLGINPYQKGVAIDVSSKPTNLAIQIQQKEQAKNEALDKYFMDYDKNITPTGMRNQDIDGLMKRKNEAKQFYFQNKQAIKRPELDNGKAYSQFIGMNQDQLGYVSKSKEQTGKAKALSTATMNANQKKQIIADGVKDAIVLNELALDDPRRVDFDIANFRAYDQYDDKKFMENVWGREELPTKIVNKDIGNGKFIPETYHLKIPEMAQFAPQRLQSAEISTRSYVRNNEGAVKYFNTLMEDPIMLKEANKAYQEYKGPNAKIVDEEDFAVAYGLLKKPGGFIKAGKEEETAAYKRQQDLNKSITLKNMGGDNTGYSPEEHINKIYENAEPNSPSSITIGGTKIEGKKVILPEEIARNYDRKFGGMRKEPSYFYMSNDKKDVYPVFVVGKTKSGADILTNTAMPDLGTKMADRIPVTTSLVPALGKLMGGVPYTRKRPISKTSGTTNDTGYTNITNSNVGQIGVKNGKWYNIKTGKPV